MTAAMDIDAGSNANANAPPARSTPFAFGQASSSSSSSNATSSTAKQQAAAAANERHESLPWVEKYRPSKLSQVSHQDSVVRTLSSALKTANLPHLLLYGPPGTGKTSTILAVARELFGPTLMKRRVLELNASNERGIDVIRHKVKEFASVAVSRSETYKGYPCPPYKIIILDEADSMTRDAQSALRRTMEQYTRVTRFCIICNYVTRIIEPITSRCAKFRYNVLTPDSMIERLQFIARTESVSINDQALTQLMKISEGDMRRCITLLQTASKIVDSNKGETIDSQLLNDVAGVIPLSVAQSTYAVCKQNAFAKIQSAATQIINQGYAVDSLLQHLMQIVLEDDEIENEHDKAEIILRISQVEKRLIDGADEWTQLLDVLAHAASIIGKPY